MKKLNFLDVWIKIHGLANQIKDHANTFELRQRYSPHHSDTDKYYEKKKFYELQQAAWKELKSLYLEHREDITKVVKEQNSNNHTEMWKTLEKVFDKEATDAIEKMLID